MNKLIGKSMLIWASMIPLAICNGALRELVLLPMMGGAAYPASGILLCALLFVVAFVFLPRLGRGTAQTYIRMGLLWVVCTVVFETLLGLLGGDSLSQILNNYNIRTGNLWAMVVVFFGCTPWLVAKSKRII